MGRHAGHCIAAQRDPSAAFSSARNCGLVEDPDVEALRLLQLAPGDAPATTAWVLRLTLELGLPPSAWIRASASARLMPVEAAGDHPRLTAPRARRHRRHARDHAGCTEMLEHGLSFARGEPRGHMRGDDRPDALDAEQVLLGCGGERIDAAEMRGERLGGVLADMPDRRAH